MQVCNEHEHSWNKGAAELLTRSYLHDMRNILTCIMLKAEMIRDAARRGDSVENHTADIQFFGARLIEMQDRLALNSPVVEKPFDPALIASEYLSVLGRTHGREVCFRAHQGTFNLLGDETLFLQMLSNLVLNAWEASAPPTSVSVSLALLPSHMQPQLCIEVIDQGVGIQAETITKIWKPFFTTKSSGSGLGLSVVRHAVERFRGVVESTSEMGKGTTMRVLLPVDMVEDPRAERMESSYTHLESQIRNAVPAK